MVRNGTLGLSSHFGLYGNLNHDVVLQDLTCQDYEVAGLQLNGPTGAILDRCSCSPLAFTPFTPAASTVMIHTLFRPCPPAAAQALVQQVRDAWAAPPTPRPTRSTCRSGCASPRPT